MTNWTDVATGEVAEDVDGALRTFDQTFYSTFWQLRTRLVIGFDLEGTDGEVAVDSFFAVLFAVVAIAALGLAVRAFFSMTLKMLLVVLSLAVMATSGLFLQFTWQQMNTDGRF